MNIQRARKCLETLTFYGQFTPGQDGYAAIEELTAFVDDAERLLTPEFHIKIEEKPPLGLMPRKIHLNHRQRDIVKAIARYQEKGSPLPTEWLQELMDNEFLLEEETK